MVFPARLETSEAIAIVADDRVVIDQQGVEFRDEFTVIETVGAVAVQIKIFTEHHVVAAAALGTHVPGADIVVPDGAGLPVVDRRHGPAAGDNEKIFIGRQVPLWSYSGEGRTAVLLGLEAGALAAIGPDDASGFGVKGMQEDSHEGPDPCSKVDLVIVDDGASAGRPGTYETIIAEDSSLAGAAAEFPDERAIGCAEAVEVAVIADDEDLVFPDSGREPHGAIGIKAPELFP